MFLLIFQLKYSKVFLSLILVELILSKFSLFLKYELYCHVTSFNVNLCFTQQLTAQKKIENKADKKFKRLNISKNDNSKLSSTRHFSQLLEEKQNLHEYAQ